MSNLPAEIDLILNGPQPGGSRVIPLPTRAHLDYLTSEVAKRDRIIAELLYRIEQVREEMRDGIEQITSLGGA